MRKHRSKVASVERTGAAMATLVEDLNESLASKDRQIVVLNEIVNEISVERMDYRRALESIMAADYPFLGDAGTKALEVLDKYGVRP